MATVGFKSKTLQKVEKKAGDQKAKTRQTFEEAPQRPLFGGTAVSPAAFLQKMSEMSSSEDELKTIAALGRGMFARSKPLPLTVAVATKLVVTNTTHLPQFRVSSNPAQGLLTGKGDTGVPALWAYAQLIWNCFYVRRLHVEVITNQSVLSNTAGDFHIGLLYESAAADTQSTTLLTAFAAGTSSRNKKYWRGAAGNPITPKGGGFWLDWKNPFPLTADSSGWQLTPSTSEIGCISFTTNLATNTDSDCYGWALCTWECMLKDQAVIS